MEGSLVTLNPVDIGLLLPGAVAVCLLAVSALVSGAETSFFSLTPHDIRDIKAHPEKSSNDAILRLLGDVDQLLATILVVNNLVNICIVILAARIINLLFTFGSAGMRFLFESVIATFLLLLFGEIIPKVFAQSRPLRFARTVARPILLMRWLMRPFAYILIRTSSTISEHAARQRDFARRAGRRRRHDRHRLGRGAQHALGHRQVRQHRGAGRSCVPRVDVVAVGIGDNYLSVRIASSLRASRAFRSTTKIWTISRESSTSRICCPTSTTATNLAGNNCCEKPISCPNTRRSTTCWKSFSRTRYTWPSWSTNTVRRWASSRSKIFSKRSSARFRTSDAVESAYTKLDDRNYLFDGKTHIGDFERILQLPENTFADVKGEAETLAGLMLEIKRDFLKKGDVVTTHDLRFTAPRSKADASTKVQVTLPE